MTKTSYTEAIAALNNAGASMRCKQVTALLKGMGFEVKDGNNGGHKIFTHQHIHSFTSSSYDCKHGRNPEINRPYIKKVLRVLEKYDKELEKYLEERDEK